MAEPPSREAAPSPLPLPTPSSLYAPSPLTPNGTRPRLGPRRQSRFTEDMTERTPAASLSEQSMDYYWYGPSAEDVTTNTNNYPVPGPGPDPGPGQQEEPTRRNRATWVRFSNAALHVAPCLVLLGIMGYAMRVLRKDLEGYMSIQAIIVIVFLSADVLLDVFTLFRAHKPWPTWGLATRIVCGIAYVALFLVYVGLGGPFPQGYTYWGVSAGFAAPVVYILLCVEGLWNLLHIPVCRYQVGRTLLGHAASTPPPNLSSTFNNRTSFNQRFSMAGTEHSSISLTWRRWVRTRSTQYNSRDDLENGFFHRSVTREPSADFTLREQPGEEDEDDHEAGSSRVTSSHGRKARGSGMKEDEKWREGLSEETVRPVGSKDIGQ